MPYTQTFLPIITNDGRILGMVPIPKTTFTGTEESVTVNGFEIPVRFVRTSVAEYIAASVTPQQERSNFQNSSWLASFVPYGWWHNQLGMAVKVERETPFVQMLRGINVKGATYSATVPKPSSQQGGAYAAEWVSCATLLGPANTFSDLIWPPQFTGIFEGEVPTSITLGRLVADPSNGSGGLKIFLIQSGIPILNSEAQFDTVRFVKTANGTLPFGKYSWEAIVTASSGNPYKVLVTLENK